MAKGLSILCLMIVIGVVSMNPSKFLGSQTTLNKLELNLSSDTFAIAVAASVMLSMIVLFSFLSRRGKDPYDVGRPTDVVKPELEPKTILNSISRLDELAARISEKLAALEPLKDNSLKDLLLNEVRTVLSKDAIESLRERSSADKIRQIFAETKARKLETADAVLRRSDTNLLFATVIFVIGVSALMYFIVTNTAAQPWQSQLLYFAPRLLAVLFVELFAYFFLSLFKHGLDDLKYFENDITTSQLREVAIHAALAAGSEAEIGAIVTAVLAAERNDSRSVELKTRSKTQDSINQRVTIEAISQIANLAKGLS